MTNAGSISILNYCIHYIIFEDLCCQYEKKNYLKIVREFFITVICFRSEVINWFLAGYLKRFDIQKDELHSIKI